MDTEGFPEDFCKALGVRKNSIRLRPHITWKPHVYLKQVELDEDSDDERETTATRRVYYSLIAAKQINVKPGKEILFAIPGLGFDTQSLVFAATEKDGNEGEDEDGTNGAQEDNTYHPKMRKGWTRPQHNPEIIANFTPRRVPVYADVAIQSEPEVSESSSQTDPPHVTVKKAVEIQVDPPPPPKSHGTAVQADILPKNTLTDNRIVVDSSFPSDAQNRKPVAVSQPTPSIIDSRSSTPMDLESPPGSPSRGSFSQSSSTAIESEFVFSPIGRSKHVSEATPNAQQGGISPSRTLTSQKDTLASSSSSRPLLDSSYGKSSPSTSAPSISPNTRNSSGLSLPTTFRAPTRRSASSIIPPAWYTARRPSSQTTNIMDLTGSDDSAGIPESTATAATAPSELRGRTTSQHTHAPSLPRPQVPNTKRPIKPPPVFVPASKPLLTLDTRLYSPSAAPSTSITIKTEPVDSDALMREPALVHPSSEAPLPSPRNPCWLIGAPWRHGLLVQVHQSHSTPTSKGYQDGEREGQCGVVIFFNFFGSTPSPDTMAKVCFLDDQKESFVPIKYLLPVPPSAPGQYAVTIGGPAAGISVKTLEARSSREWFVVARFSGMQSVMSTDVLCKLEWGQGPPNGFLQDPAPQQALLPVYYFGRPKSPIDGFGVSTKDEPNPSPSLRRNTVLPPKPTPSQLISAFGLPLKPDTVGTSSETLGTTSETPAVPFPAVPPAKAIAPLPDQSMAFARATPKQVVRAPAQANPTAGPSKAHTRQASTSTVWVPPADAALPPRPSTFQAPQNDVSLGKRKRRNGKNRQRRGSDYPQPPIHGDSYRPGYDDNETFRPDYSLGEVVPPPAFGDSYRPIYGDKYNGTMRGDHYSPRDERRSPRDERHPGYDRYVPDDLARGRSISREQEDEDIASSREASPLPAKRSKDPDPMEALDRSTYSLPQNDDYHAWPTLKPIHAVSLSGTDGAPLDVRDVVFSPSGKFVAVCCGDDYVRVFDAAGLSEPFKLRHDFSVASVAWMDDAAGLMSIGINGVITKWVPLMSQNPIRWHSAKVHEAKQVDPVAFTYSSNRVAAVFSNREDGVKMWEWGKGIWKELRGIKRSGVTAVKFIHEGAALLGATADGVVWYCEVPNGTMRATTFLQQKIISLNMDDSGIRALVTLDNGHAHIISTPAKGKLGEKEKTFEVDKTPTGAIIEFPTSAIFTGVGEEVLLGRAEGCLLLWSRASAKLVAGLLTDDNGAVRVVASQSSAKDRFGCVIAGTKGRLTWWAQPNLSNPAKRAKLD